MVKRPAQSRKYTFKIACVDAKKVIKRHNNEANTAKINNNELENYTIVAIKEIESASEAGVYIINKIVIELTWTTLISASRAMTM